MIQFLRRLVLPDGAAYRRRINRAPSSLLAIGLPWASVMLASVVPLLLTIASAPVMPPFGFLFLLGWRQLHPGLLPVWAGLPLGLFDDLYSGQPFGSATLLWSVAMILLDVIEARFPWRHFAIEWLVAGALIAAYAIACLAIANAGGGTSPVQVIVPQIVLSIMVYPLVGRLVALLDRVRLTPLVDAR